MYIRNREDALSALAEILELPERRTQIIRCTVGIMQCLDADPRDFLADCQVMLISGGLETLREKRREMFEQLQDNDLVVVIDPEENREFEAIASAFDALRLSDVVREVFPALTTRYQPWEVARALIGSEASVQGQIVAGLRARKGSPADFEEALRGIEALVISHLPEWRSRTEEIRRSCVAVVRQGGLTDREEAAAEGEVLFNVVATSDTRAIPFLERAEHDPSAAVEFLGRIHELSVALRAMEKEAGAAPAKNVA
ncbi:MAG: hypothetical protein HYY17_14565 [Planctomycetes bacterium]|nr:hypothetical protein [Planctomycetota bacterium]